MEYHHGTGTRADGSNQAKVWKQGLFSRNKVAFMASYLDRSPDHVFALITSGIDKSGEVPLDCRLSEMQ